MNSEQQKAYDHAQVELAFALGEKIECYWRTTGAWLPTQSSSWNWEYHKYRVAPKPIECWAWLYESGRLGPVYDSQQEAERYSSINGGHAILMREVIQ